MTSAAAMALDDGQAQALEYPHDGPLLALTGAPGSGKSFALLHRAIRLSREMPGVWLSAPGQSGVSRLRAEVERAGSPGLRCESLGAIALEVLRLAEPGVELELIDDVRACEHFEAVGASLFSLDWTEFVGAEIDPEITGLRAPQHFSVAAFRLIRKLRSALISPSEFLAHALRGATQFYGRPPNFAAHDLLIETPVKYRDSLLVSAEESAQQHAREIDLAKILTRLYESYVEALVANGCLTEIDALYEASMQLRRRPELGAAAKARLPAALVDDAQDLLPSQFELLEAIYGKDLRGVTIAGDLRQASRSFAGARGDAAFKAALRTIVLQRGHRCDRAILAVADRSLEPAERSAEFGSLADATNVDFYRAETVAEEARFVAATTGRLIAEGAAPGEIAVILRNLSCAGSYVDALLARDIETDISGEMSLYDQPAADDALAALWTVVDPFRHDYLLRAFEAPWMRLSDAAIATLCAEPEDAQAVLFELPEAEPEEIRRRDGRKALRLGFNFARGDADSALSSDARERVRALRAARERWLQLARRLPPAQLARAILEETVSSSLEPGARGRFRENVTARVLAEIEAFALRAPLGTLEDYLAYAENVARDNPDLLRVAPRRTDCVRVLDVEAAKGLEFDYVFVVDVRAGAFPRYYVPDAFLFSPTLGMIPKENVGETARTARTAKFTYAMYKLRARQQYNAAERRAFYCAASRARTKLYISASGRPTRGTNTPEIWEELRQSFRRP